MLTPVQNIQGAMRQFERLAPFNAGCVGSLVPKEFQRYARIFHPAWRVDRGQRIALRWADMAEYTEATPHALMQWNSISAPTMRGAEVEPPYEGTLPRAVSQPLRDILERHSAGADCWLGVWAGLGGRSEKGAPVTATIDTGHREWALYRAPLSMIDTPLYAGSGRSPRQTANLIWCEDPGWWIHTEIDLNTTYIGGDEQLIQAVLESAALEAWPVSADDDITIHADTVNSVAPATRRQGTIRPVQARLGKQRWPNERVGRNGSDLLLRSTKSNTEKDIVVSRRHKEIVNSRRHDESRKKLAWLDYSICYGRGYLVFSRSSSF